MLRSLPIQDLVEHPFKEPGDPIIILKKIVQHLVVNGKRVLGHLYPSVLVWVILYLYERAGGPFCCQPTEGLPLFTHNIGLYFMAYCIILKYWLLLFCDSSVLIVSWSIPMGH